MHRDTLCGRQMERSLTVLDTDVSRVNTRLTSMQAQRASTPMPPLHTTHAQHSTAHRPHHHHPHNNHTYLDLVDGLVPREVEEGQPVALQLPELHHVVQRHEAQDAAVLHELADVERAASGALQQQYRESDEHSTLWRAYIS
jgi:adenylosuccinate lyase